MKKVGLLGIMLCASQATANDWERFYTALPAKQTMPSATPPEVISSSGRADQDVESMWRKGYAPIGYSSFSTGNDKINDALKFAKKLHARYVIVATQLTSSNTSTVPLTMPNTTTSYTNGTASAYGSGGYATGSYSGTTTTYGTKTTYIPITINRFDKMGIYFQEAPKLGTGIFPRELSQEEMAQLETRRGFAVRFVRDGSPAYNADILPGDLIMQVDGHPADETNWSSAISKPGEISVHLIRRGEPRDIKIAIPPEWATRSLP